MSTDTSEAHESIDARTRRALAERLTVLTPDGFPVTDADRTVVSVTSASGETYRVDVRDGRCTCPDARHRGATCKHIRRARFALGRESIPADAAAAVDVDPSLGEHVNATLRFAAADGGIVEAGDEGEILTDDDSADAPGRDETVWSETFPEYDRYGNRTGASLVRCTGCGIEVTTGGTDTAAHRDGCPHQRA